MTTHARVSILAILVGAASGLAGCGGKGGTDGAPAHRQASATGSAATPNLPAESVGAGAVTCMGGELVVANSAGPAGAITRAANDVTV